MSVVQQSHVWTDDSGTAWIDRTNIKVVEVALERLAHGCSVEEIVDQHKGTLSLAQVHAALAHYNDNLTEFESLIESQLARADRLRSQSLNSPGRLKLQQSGQI